MLKNRIFRIAMNYLQESDTKGQPGQVTSPKAESEDLLEYIKRKIESIKQPLVSRPPYRGDFLEYLKQKNKEKPPTT